MNAICCKFGKIPKNVCAAKKSSRLPPGSKMPVFRYTSRFFCLQRVKNEKVKKTYYLCGGAGRPAPAKLPQGGNTARVCG
jgi:hypothetical protein